MHLKFSSSVSAILCAHACFTPKCLTFSTKRRVKSGSLIHLELKWLPLHCICIIDKHFVRCCSFQPSAMRNSCGLISQPCIEGLWCHGRCDKWTPTLTRTIRMHLSDKTEIQSHQVKTFTYGNSVYCACLLHLRAVSLPNLAARAMEGLVSQSVTALGNNFLCLMSNPSFFGENFANSCSILCNYSKFNYSLLWENKNQRLIIIDRYILILLASIIPLYLSHYSNLLILTTRCS